MLWKMLYRNRKTLRTFTGTCGCCSACTFHRNRTRTYSNMLRQDWELYISGRLRSLESHVVLESSGWIVCYHGKIFSHGLSWIRCFGTVSFLCNTPRYYGTWRAMSLFSNLHFKKTKILPSNTSCRVFNIDLHLCCCSRVLAMDHTSIREFWRSEEDQQWNSWKLLVYVHSLICTKTSDTKKNTLIKHQVHRKTLWTIRRAVTCHRFRNFWNHSTLRCRSLVSHF